MAVILLAKIVKSAWLEQPIVQGTVDDLLSFCQVSDKHNLLALTTIDELIVEMSYFVRGVNLHGHRRISASFRDNSLLKVFSKSIECVKKYLDTALAMQALEQVTLSEAATGQTQ